MNQDCLKEFESVRICSVRVDELALRSCDKIKEEHKMRLTHAHTLNSHTRNHVCEYIPYATTPRTRQASVHTTFPRSSNRKQRTAKMEGFFHHRRYTALVYAHQPPNMAEQLLRRIGNRKSLLPSARALSLLTISKTRRPRRDGCRIAGRDRTCPSCCHSGDDA